MSERFLVTGAMGCLGAWVVKQLLDENVPVTAFDLSSNDRRLRLVCGEQAADVGRVQGDITKAGSVTRALRDHEITHVVHCAAFQVPFVQADPVLGANVNVGGTVNVFEAVLACREQVKGISYASAAAVFGPPSMYEGGVVDDDSPQYPVGNLYGVYKQANEWAARFYANTHGIGTVGLRPWVVYGLGRDQGMTSTITKALVAASAGVSYRIGFGGRMLFQYAPDMARVFIACARAAVTDAQTFNIGGSEAAIADYVELIADLEPSSRGQITFEPEPLPVVGGARSSGLEKLIGPVVYTPLEEGVRATIDAFKANLDSGVEAFGLEPA
jgi:UDP-glucuronate 4-epimerase